MFIDYIAKNEEEFNAFYTNLKCLIIEHDFIIIVEKFGELGWAKYIPHIVRNTNDIVKLFEGYSDVVAYEQSISDFKILTIKGFKDNERELVEIYVPTRKCHEKITTIKTTLDEFVNKYYHNSTYFAEPHYIDNFTNLTQSSLTEEQMTIIKKLTPKELSGKYQDFTIMGKLGQHKYKNGYIETACYIEYNGNIYLVALLGGFIIR